MAWLTPETVPTGIREKTLNIPDDDAWYAAVKGALLDLTQAHNWQQVGSVTPEEAATRFWQMFQEFVNS